MIFYFSGTGNSQWVAQSVAEAFQDKTIAIGNYFSGEKSPKPNFTISDNEKIGFIFPVHSWGIPPIVGKFINALQIENYTQQQIYCILTCGDECGYSNKMLQQYFAKKNWTCRHIYSLIMPNNYICMQGFDVDDPQKTEEKKRNALRDLPLLIKTIADDIPIDFYADSKRFAFVKSKIIYPLFVKYAITDKAFTCSDTCTACGLCVKKCPVENIHLRNGKPIWGGNCTQCLACIHFCPVKAIEYGNASVGKGRYTFKKLQETTK